MPKLLAASLGRRARGKTGWGVIFKLRGRRPQSAARIPMCGCSIKLLDNILWNCESAAITLEKQRNAGKRNLKVFDKSGGTVEQQKRTYNLKIIVGGRLPS